MFFPKLEFGKEAIYTHLSAYLATLLPYSPTHPLTNSPTHPLTYHPLTLLTHSSYSPTLPTHPLTYLPTHPLTYSPTHPTQILFNFPLLPGIISYIKCICYNRGNIAFFSFNQKFDRFSLKLTKLINIFVFHKILQNT